jgi:ATP-dependent DNA helicase RecG
MNLKEIIKSGESEITEFKTSLAEWRDVVETISAFSNRNGGRILIGVADNCELIGVDIGGTTIEKLANQIKQNTDPVIHPSIRVEKIDEKQVIDVHVEENEQKPVMAFGRAFIRVGKSTQNIGYNEIRHLVVETSKVYWDERICKDASLEDIDEEKVRFFLTYRKV